MFLSRKSFIYLCCFGLTACDPMTKAQSAIQQLNDTCSAVPTSSPLYQRFGVDPKTELIIHYSYEKSTKLGRCWISFVNSSNPEDVFLDYPKSEDLGPNQVDDSLYFRATLERKELPYRIVCDALINSSVLEPVTSDFVKAMRLSGDSSGKFSCATQFEK
jgi:hypothetical protein